MAPVGACRRYAESKDAVTDSLAAVRGTGRRHRPPEQNPAAAMARPEKCLRPQCIPYSAQPCACIEGGSSQREPSTFPSSLLPTCPTAQDSVPPPISAPAQRYLSVLGRT